MRKIGNKDFQLSPQDTQFQEHNKFNIANVFWVAIALFLKKTPTKYARNTWVSVNMVNMVKNISNCCYCFFLGNIRSILAVSRAGNFLYPAARMQI